MRFECMMKLMRQTTTARRSLHHDDKHGLLQLQAKKPISLLLGVDHDALYATYPVVKMTLQESYKLRTLSSTLFLALSKYEIGGSGVRGLYRYES